MIRKIRNRRFKNGVLLLLFCVLYFKLCSVSYAGGPGTTGAAFLKIGMGARAVGMGEAFVGVSNDITAISWNPAGLDFIKDKELSFMYSLWLLDTYHGYVAYGQRLDKISSVGASIAYFGYGNVARVLEDANGYPIETGENFAPSDVAVTLAYSRMLNRFDVGASMKLIYETLDPQDSQGRAFAFGFDVGMLYELYEILPGLILGATIQNLGIPLKFVNEGAALPTTLKVGVGYNLTDIIDIKDLSGVASMDVIVPFDNSITLHMGVEMRIMDMFAMRAGYKIDRMIDINPLAGFSIGGGVKLQEHYCVDFAYVPYGDLGQTLKMSFGAEF